MKRSIAFISSGFTGSIIPLISTLVSKDYNIDLYLLQYKTQNHCDFEALEQTRNDLKFGLNYIGNESIIGLPNNLTNENFRLFIVCNIGNGGSSILKKRISGCISNLIVKNVVRKIQNNQYSHINIVGHDELSGAYDKYLFNANVYHTFHEIYDHSNSSNNLLPSVLSTIKYRIPIIVPSKYLKSFLNNIYPDYPVIFIPFGNFENYKRFDKGINQLDLPDNYLLFIGNLLPYKGIDFLYDCYKYLKEKGHDIKIVIAGSGNSKLLPTLHNDHNFTILQRWIKNEELVELIKRSKGVVCPYLSASQSGIPVTASVFGKYVIATNVGAMSEYISPFKNGYIIEKGNVVDFADRMLDLYSSNRMIDNNELIQKELGHDWDTISDNYVNFSPLYKTNDNVIKKSKLFINRCFRCFWKYYNILSLNINGVKVGHNPWIINKVDIRNDGYIQIGNYCSIISEEVTFNPLVSNNRTCLASNKNASLLIGDNVGISSSVIWSHKSITIGNRVSIGAMCTIIDSDCHSLNYKDRGTSFDLKNKIDSPIVVGDDVLIGTRSIILKGVTIGPRSIIGAGSVVVKDIPADCIAAGNPCKVIKLIN